MEKVTVIKVGGAVVEDEATLQALIHDFASLEGLKVLVHGGGRSATRIASQLGIESQMVGGRRITGEEMISVVTMVYGGLVSKRLVALLQAEGVNALGVTGADMDLIRSHKRPLKEVTMDDGSKQMIDFGWVGDVDRADGKQLKMLLESGVVPVVAPLTHDGEGHILNTNADTMAQTVATALAPYYNVTLTYCFEKPGVLRDAEDDNSVISTITPNEYAQLKADCIVSGGMIPKLDNAFQALESGVERVIITQATNLDGSKGTCLMK